MNADKVTSIRMDFEDNDILALLSGEHNQYLAHIEKSLDVSPTHLVTVLKSPVRPNPQTARRVIEDLYKKIHAGGRQILIKVWWMTRCAG